MFSTVKSLLGYPSRGLIDETQRSERGDSPTPSQKRGAEQPEMAEMKRHKITEQITTAADTREKTSQKERGSIDSRRKDIVKGQETSTAHTYEQPARQRREQPQRPDIERPRKGKSVDPVAKDDRETSSMKEQSSKDSKKEMRSRGRSFSASVQDITSMKPYSPSPFVERTKEGTLVDSGKRDIVRGRANSMVRRDARSLEFKRVVDDRSTERSRKRRETSVVRDPMMKDIIEHNSSLKSKLETTQDLLRSAEQKKIELYKMMSSLREEKAQLLEREGAMKREAAMKERDAQQKTAEILVKNRRQEDEIRHLKDRLRHAEEMNSHTNNLLQVRTADLRGAEAFLTTADQYSGTDIINMVKALNAEIFQTAAYMAELLEDPSTVATEDDCKKNMQKYVRSLEDAHFTVGDSLFKYFLDKGVHVRSDPLPLQLAFQCIFSRWCIIKTQSFCDNESFDHFLKGVYQEIQGCEAQAVAGRWRAITCSNMKSRDHQTHQTLSDHVLDMAIGLLCLCGWSLSSPRSQKAILNMQQFVKFLERLWLELKSVTQELTTAADFDLFVIDFNRPYDDTKMEDNYCDTLTKSSSNTKNGTRVLCSVGVGLQKRVVRRVEGLQSKPQTDILIKAKVALETVLRDIQDGSDVSGKHPSPNRLDNVS